MRDILLAIITNPAILAILCSFVVVLTALGLHHRRAMARITRLGPATIDLPATKVADFERRLEAEFMAERR